MAAPIQIRAHEEPLPTAEMARASHQNDALVNAAYPNAQAAPINAAHVGSYGAGGDFAPVTRPSDTDRPRGCAWSNQSVAGQLVNVELEAAFQSYPVTCSRHHVLIMSSQFQPQEIAARSMRLLPVALTKGGCVTEH